MNEFAGTLNQRIEIWRDTAERLPTGASSGAMSKLLSCLASIVTDGAGSPTEAMSVSAMSRFRVTVRANEEIAVGQEVRWKGRRLSIHQVIDNPALPDRLVLRCEEER